MGEALLKRQKLQGKDPTDDFPYDVEIDMPATGKLDILYTADIHCGWKDFGSNRWASQVFSLDKNSLTVLLIVNISVASLTSTRLL